jgi:hypothetical protein
LIRTRLSYEATPDLESVAMRENLWITPTAMWALPVMRP